MKKIINEKTNIELDDLKNLSLPDKTSRYTTLSDGDTTVEFGRNKIVFSTKKQAERKQIKNKLLVRVGTPVLVIVTIATVVFFPAIKSEILAKIEEIKTDNRPKTRYGSYIPDYKNIWEYIEKKTGEEQLDSLNLSENATVALSTLKSRLGVELKRYLSISQDITPSLLIVDYENHSPTTFTLICDLEDGQSVSFKYKVDDSKSFTQLLDSRETEITDIINGFTDSIKSKNLIDMPEVNEKITTDKTYYTTTILEEGKQTTWNEVTENYNIEDFYVFSLISSDKGKVYEKEISIKKSTIEGFSDFDKEDTSSLYKIYKAHPDKFENDSEIELGSNNLSIIFSSAKKQEGGRVTPTSSSNRNFKTENNTLILTM